MVRISHENTVFKRAYNEKFSKEIFKKSQRFRMQGIPMYTIKEFSNEVVKGNFYESEYKELMKNEDSLWIICLVVLRFWLTDTDTENLKKDLFNG